MGDGLPVSVRRTRASGRQSRNDVRLTGTALVALFALACGGDGPVRPTPPTVEPPAPPTVTTTALVGDAVLVGAGDVGMCGIPEVAMTANLLETIPGTIVALGDLAYPTGSASDFATCYDPTWGRLRERTRPAPGNHDYETQQGAPYYAYFGENAGPTGRGYYSYRAGAWLVLSLNSNIPATADSAQAAWVRATLASNPTACTLAYWHYPLFSSGPNGSIGTMRDIWRILQEGGADVVLSGHDHLYERFTAQDAMGRADPRHGLREFVVGTGGAHLYAPRVRQPNSEVVASVHGVLKLTLKAKSYDWQFVPVPAPGKSFSDFGTGECQVDGGPTAMPGSR
jgi:acid phosphatase type 7